MEREQQVGMVGDAQIGKTSLMVKYVEGTFDEDYIQTLGAQPVIAPRGTNSVACISRPLPYSASSAPHCCATMYTLFYLLPTFRKNKIKG